MISILLIEDNHGDVRIIRRTLDVELTTGNISDYTLIVANTGEEALCYLNEHKPHLVILDLNLAGMHGFEVLKTVKADLQTRLIPIIVLTTSRNSEDVRRAYLLGASAFMSKPVGFHKFGDLIAALARYWVNYVRYDG